MEINGKKVVDAKAPAKIAITAEDVAKGANKNPSGCAAALAAMHDIKDCISARVHVGRVYIETPRRWVRYMTPESLRTEIIAFDRGGSFQPGQYELKAPSKQESEEGRRSYREKKTVTDKAYPVNGRSAAQRAKDDASREVSRKRIPLKVAKIKRHEVTGIRPKGAVR